MSRMTWAGHGKNSYCQPVMGLNAGWFEVSAWLNGSCGIYSSSSSHSQQSPHLWQRGHKNVSSPQSSHSSRLRGTLALLAEVHPALRSVGRNEAHYILITVRKVRDPSNPPIKRSTVGHIHPPGAHQILQVLSSAPASL